MKATEFAGGGDFLKAVDLQGKARKLTMAGTRVDTFNNDGKQVDKLIVQFKQTDKELVLNVTNVNRIIEQHGDETDNWMGKEIIIQPEKVDFGGQRVDAIRVRVPEPELAPGDPDDDLPF